MRVKDNIAALIRAAGPLSVAQYMDTCLYHPQQGYYMTRVPMSADGDFITAPEMTQAFGEVLGAWVADCWNKLGRPTPWALVELGPGRGTLMGDVLRILQKHAPAAYAGCEVHLAEISPLLQTLQRQGLAGHPITWHSGVDDLPKLNIPLVLLANEFWDALPIRQFMRRDGLYHERLITLDEAGNLAFTLDAAATPLPGYSQDVVEICPALPGLAQRLKGLTTAPCYQLYIDYGAAGTADTLQAMRQHSFTPLLQHPGDADLTAHVNFAALEEAFGHNWVQEDMAGFMFRLGFPVRAAHLMDAAKTPQDREKIALNCAKIMAPDGMGSLFKVGCFYSPNQPTPAGFE